MLVVAWVGLCPRGAQFTSRGRSKKRWMVENQEFSRCRSQVKKQKRAGGMTPVFSRQTSLCEILRASSDALFASFSSASRCVSSDWISFEARLSSAVFSCTAALARSYSSRTACSCVRWCAPRGLCSVLKRLWLFRWYWLDDKETEEIQV